MGIYNRDYVQGGDPYGQGSYTPSTGGVSAVAVLIAINVIIFIFQSGSQDRFGQGGITDWLALNAWDLRNFEVWRLLTYGFCHSGNMHLIANMWMLWLFGRLIEPIYGKREFIAFYLTGVMLSGIGHVIFQVVNHNPSGVVGASGGVMAVVFLAAMTYPRERIFLFFVIPIEFRWLAVMYAVGDVLGAFNPNSEVAHFAHLAGAAFGIAYKYYGWRLTGFSSGWIKGRLFPQGGKTKPRRAAASKHVKLYEPPPTEADLEIRVDAILDKIHTQGEASLTDEEREILKQASQRYKNRSKQ